MMPQPTLPPGIPASLLVFSYLSLVYRTMWAKVQGIPLPDAGSQLRPASPHHPPALSWVQPLHCAQVSLPIVPAHSIQGIVNGGAAQRKAARGERWADEPAVVTGVIPAGQGSVKAVKRKNLSSCYSGHDMGEEGEGCLGAHLDRGERDR